MVRQNALLTGFLEACRGKSKELSGRLNEVTDALLLAKGELVRLTAERDQADQRFWDERDAKVKALGRLDTTTRELVEARAELADTAAENAEYARTIGRLNDDMAKLQADNMKQRGQIEDQAEQLERQGADIQRLRHASNIAELARHKEALARMEEQGGRDRALIEELEAELARRGVGRR